MPHTESVVKRELLTLQGKARNVSHGPSLASGRVILYSFLFLLVIWKRQAGNDLPLFRFPLIGNLATARCKHHFYSPPGDHIQLENLYPLWIFIQSLKIDAAADLRSEAPPIMVKSPNVSEIYLTALFAPSKL